LLLPKKILEKWGAVAEEGFAFVTEALQSRGFKGPLTWSHVSLIPYSIRVCDTISVDLSISSASGHNGVRFFDCSAVILSKTLNEKTLPSDPWPRWSLKDGKQREGYIPCMAISLAHLKWASAPSDSNPCWSFTLADTDPPGLKSWLVDFDALMLPMIQRLSSDEELIKLMWEVIQYKKPHWVLSSKPSFAFFEALFMALQR